MKNQLLRKMFISFLVVVWVVTLSACGSSKKNDSTATQTPAQVSDGTQASATPTANEQVTLKLFSNGVFSGFNFPPGVQDDPVAKEIAKVTGVTVDFQSSSGSDDSKFNALLASGDLPDVLFVDNTKMKQLVEGNNIIPLGDLVQKYGPDILANKTKSLDFSKKYYSNGTNELYLIPAGEGKDNPNYRGIALVTRWDYYKELGTPTYNSFMDMLPILAQMQKNHPTNDEGKKVYALSPWFDDWGLWNLIVYQQNLDGRNAEGPGMMDVDNLTTEATSYITDENSMMWQAAKFFNKGNQMGILDPDSFTQKYDNFVEKVNSNRVLFSWVDWAVSSGTQTLSKAGHPDQGWEALPPPKGTFNYAGGNSPVASMGYAISKNSKHPEAAMKLINYLNSFDGTELIYNGPKGLNWDIVNGKPTMNDKGIDAFLNDPNYWATTGGMKYWNLHGYSTGTIDTRYGTPMMIGDSAEVRAKNVSPLDKDFSTHYGATYPNDVVANMVANGEVKATFPTALQSASLAVTPDDIKRLDDSIMTYLKTNVVKLIAAKTDADFDAGKKKIISDLMGMGLQKSIDYWTKAYADAKVIVDQYM